MRPDELSVLGPTTIEARLARVEQAVANLAACLGLDVEVLAEQGEQSLEDNAVARLERMVLDLADAVRLQALWVREGERAGHFSPKQIVRARLQMEVIDLQGELTQIERAIQANPPADLLSALEQRANVYREQLRAGQAKLDRLPLTLYARKEEK
jgi:hypothetical protein